MTLPMQMLFVCLQYVHSQGSMHMLHDVLPTMLCSGPKLIMTVYTVAQQHLQIALLLICELSVLQSHLVERMVVLSVMTFIKHLHPQQSFRVEAFAKAMQARPDGLYGLMGCIADTCCRDKTSNVKRCMTGTTLVQCCLHVTVSMTSRRGMSLPQQAGLPSGQRPAM